eukprot:279847_1
MSLCAKRLENKYCVITGAAYGIGQSIAILFADHGANIALLDIASCSETINLIKNSINYANTDAFEMKCDISDETNIISAVSSICNRWNSQKIDILVNNACIFIYNSVLSASNKNWNKVLSTNIKGHALIIKHMIPIMKHSNNNKSTSSIINISSQSGVFAQPNTITYSICKAAIIQLTKNCALDLWPKYKIRVNAVCPGGVNTGIRGNKRRKGRWIKSETDKTMTLEQWKSISNKVNIMQRRADVDEIAKSCLFFATNDSSFCTGSILMVDGGYSSI